MVFCEVIPSILTDIRKIGAQGLRTVKAKGLKWILSLIPLS